MFKRTLIALVIPFSLLAVACTPTEPELAKEQLDAEKTPIVISDQVHHNLTHLASTVGFLNDVLDQGMGDTSDSQCPISVVIDKETGETTEVEFPCDENIDGPGKTLSQGIEELRDDIIEMLKQNIMIPDQLESEDEDTLVYKLSPEVQCGDDDDCVKLLTDYPVRFKIGSHGPGAFQISVMFGPEKLVPIIFETTHHDLSAYIDLAVTKKVIAYIMANTPEMNEGLKLPDVATGKLHISLKQGGIKASTLKIGVTETIAIKLNNDDGAMLFAGELKPGSLSATFDGHNEIVQGNANLGALYASITYQTLVDAMAGTECYGTPDMEEPICEKADTPKVNGTLELEIPGLSADVVVDIAKKLLDVTGLGFGSKTSTLTLDKKTVLAFDLNKNDGRKIDFSVFENALDQVQVDLSPVLQAVLVTKLGAISDAFYELPEMLKDDALELLFNGADMPSVAFVKHGMKVLAGTLSLSSAQAPNSTLAAEAGQCVMEAQSEPGPNDHPILDIFETGMCPVK